MATARIWKMLLVLLSLTLLGAQAPQQRRDPQEYIKLLESETRVENLQIDRVIRTLAIQPGHKVADVGAGSGLFTRPIARQVGEKGMVYAIDIDPDLLKHVEQTAKDAKLSNVRTVLAAAADPQIPEPVDLILMVDTLHHIRKQGAYLKVLRRYLRPRGRLAIIDFSERWPAGHEDMRFSLADLEKWAQEAQCRRVQEHNFIPNSFFAVYQCEPPHVPVTDRFERVIAAKEPGFEPTTKSVSKQPDHKYVLQGWKSNEEWVSVSTYELASQEEAAETLRKHLAAPISVPVRRTRLSDIGDEAYMHQSEHSSTAFLQFRKSRFVLSMSATSVDLAGRFAKHLANEID